MVHLNTISMSESEEMYLVWIARIGERGHDGPIPISHIAQKMEIQPVSVNQMVHKLEELGLVAYTPYQGVILTQDGESYARDILRRRRLWEVFLVEHLKLSLEEADELACRMEHIFPGDVVTRLDDFLGNPTLSPGEKQIPRPGSTPAIRGARPLDQLEVGARGELISIELDQASRSFLKLEGLLPGTGVAIMAISGSGNMLIHTEEGNRLNLAQDLTRHLWLRQKPNP